MPLHGFKGLHLLEQASDRVGLAHLPSRKPLIRAQVLPSPVHDVRERPWLARTVHIGPRETARNHQKARVVRLGVFMPYRRLAEKPSQATATISQPRPGA